MGLKKCFAFFGFSDDFLSEKKKYFFRSTYFLDTDKSICSDTAIDELPSVP